MHAWKNPLRLSLSNHATNIDNPKQKHWRPLTDTTTQQIGTSLTLGGGVWCLILLGHVFNRFMMQNKSKTKKQVKRGKILKLPYNLSAMECQQTLFRFRVFFGWGWIWCMPFVCTIQIFHPSVKDQTRTLDSDKSCIARPCSCEVIRYLPKSLLTFGIHEFWQGVLWRVEIWSGHVWSLVFMRGAFFRGSSRDARTNARTRERCSRQSGTVTNLMWRRG